MAPSGSIVSCFGRKKQQQEEPQTSNGLNKPFRCLKQFCCIGKIHTQSSDPSASANIELSAPANIAPSASANIKPSASADDPAADDQQMIRGKEKQQEEPQTSNGLNKPFRWLKQLCCIGKIPIQDSEPIQDPPNNAPSAESENPAPSNHPFGPEIVGNAADYPEIATLLATPMRKRPIQSSEIVPASENNEPSTSAGINPADLIHPYGPEIAHTADYPPLPNQTGFPRFTDPEIASLLASQIWRMLGENIPNELGFIRSTLFNFRTPFLRLFYLSGLVPPEREGGFGAGLYDANRSTWAARLRNLPPSGIGLDYEDFANHYRIFARDYVYLLETDNPQRMLLVFMRRNSMTNSLAAWLVPYYDVGFPPFAPP